MTLDEYMDHEPDCGADSSETEMQYQLIHEDAMNELDELIQTLCKLRDMKGRRAFTAMIDTLRHVQDMLEEEAY